MSSKSRCLRGAMRTKPLLVASAALALALPAIAQRAAQPAQPATSPPPAGNATVPAATTAEPLTSAATSGSVDETAVEEVGNVQLAPQAPAIEYPAYARRDIWFVGSLDPSDIGFDQTPWGSASGAFLSTLLRRMDVPLASRWAHIALRDALLVQVHAPAEVDPIDWVAERAWLLLRRREADAAR